MKSIVKIAGVCNISGWRVLGNGQNEMSPFFLWRLANARSSKHQAIEHPRLGFIAPHRAAAHLHSTDDLLSAVVRPGHIGLPIEDPVVGPMFAQANK